MKRIIGLILIFSLILSSSIFSQISAESILKEVGDKWGSAKDIQMKLSITLYSYSSKGESIPQKMTMEMFYITNPLILRINFLEPALFSGQIILIDSEKKLMRVYIPATKQILESEFTQTLTYTSGINLPFISGKEEDFNLEVAELIEKNEKFYKIIGKPNTPELKTQMSYFELYLNKSELKPIRLKIFDIYNRLYMDMLWTELKINQNLSATKLRTLPQGKIIKQKEPQNITPIPFFSPGK
ncbi:MAG: hypothetical protein NZ841_00100 [Dictyoglomus sp.]|nr:hypothetical protein [Dictyoglomus sp.]MDW8187698.1 hypothetical protein [Dictyoglomus sp.]